MTLTKNELLIKVAAIVTTLDEIGGSPEFMLYIFCDMDMDKWIKLRYILVETGLVQIKSNYVTLTDSGKVTASKLNKALVPK